MIRVDLIKKMKYLEYFPNFLDFPNFPEFPRSFRNLEMDNASRSLFVYFQILESWKVGKFGKHASAVATPLGNSPVFLVQAKGNKDDRSAQAVQDRASLTPAETRADFSTRRDSKVTMRTAVAALRQRSARRR